MKIKIFIFIFLILSCEGGYGIMISLKALNDKNCEGSRDFILKESSKNGVYDIKGTIEFINGKFNNISKRGIEVFNENEDYVTIAGFSQGSGYDWLQLHVTCNSNGELIYDSGKVTREKGFCFDGNRFYFILEGKSKVKNCLN